MDGSDVGFDINFMVNLSYHVRRIIKSRIAISMLCQLHVTCNG